MGTLLAEDYKPSHAMSLATRIRTLPNVERATSPTRPVLTSAQLLHDGQDLGSPLQRHQRKFTPLSTKGFCSLFPAGEALRSPVSPEKKSRCRLWRVPAPMLTLPLYRLSSAPLAASSSAAPPWPSWMPVTPTSSTTSRLKCRVEAKIPVGIHTALGSGENDMTIWRYPAAQGHLGGHIRHPDLHRDRAFRRLVVVHDNSVF